LVSGWQYSYSLVQLEFINENTGYATWGGNGIVKTTNGGLNWSIQYMPSNNGIVYNNINRFYFILVILYTVIMVLEILEYMLKE